MRYALLCYKLSVHCTDCATLRIELYMTTSHLLLTQDSGRQSHRTIVLVAELSDVGMSHRTMTRHSTIQSGLAQFGAMPGLDWLTSYWTSIFRMTISWHYPLIAFGHVHTMKVSMQSVMASEVRSE